MKILAFLVILVSISQAQIEPTPTPTPAELRKQATIKEFSVDPFNFTQTLHLQMADQVASNTMTNAAFVQFSKAYWKALEGQENKTNAFAAFYESVTAPRRKELQAVARSIRSVYRAAKEAESAKAAAEESILGEE